jgi:hypothetical protein
VHFSGWKERQERINLRKTEAIYFLGKYCNKFLASGCDSLTFIITKNVKHEKVLYNSRIIS